MPPPMISTILGMLLGAASLLDPVLSLFAAGAVFAATPDRGVDRAGATHRDGAIQLSRTLVVIGLVVGVSISGEVAAMTWSATLLQHEAPRLAVIAGCLSLFARRA